MFVQVRELLGVEDAIDFGAVLELLVKEKTEGLVDGDAWSDFLPGSKDIIADWTEPTKCGNYNTVTKTCSGQNM